MQTSNVLRPWKYNSAIMEYFVEDECKQLLKRSELTKQVEQTELDVGIPVILFKSQLNPWAH